MFNQFCSHIIHEAYNNLWLIIGMGGQALFSARFIVQWLASEKAGKSVVPHLFWYFSVLGGLTLLVYAIYRQDPVFILGQGSGLLIYARNLYFIHRKTPSKQLATTPNSQ